MLQSKFFKTQVAGIVIQCSLLDLWRYALHQNHGCAVFGAVFGGQTIQNAFNGIGRFFSGMGFRAFKTGAEIQADCNQGADR